MILLLKFGTLLGARRTVHYLVMCLESLISEDELAVPNLCLTSITFFFQSVGCVIDILSDIMYYGNDMIVCLFVCLN